MAIEDDDYYAMPGTAMNSYFDSATLGDMLTTYLEPSFASKNYDQGVKRFFEAVYEKVVDDLNLNLTISDAVSDYNAFLLESSSKGAASAHLPDTERESRHGGGISFGTILLIVILLVVLIAATRRFGRRSRRAAYAPPPPPVRPPRRNSMSFPLGFMLGRMTANRPRAPRPGPGVPPPMGGFGIPPKAQSRPNSNRPSSGSFSGGFSPRSGGMGRSSSSRPGGFGGASRREHLYCRNRRASEREQVHRSWAGRCRRPPVWHEVIHLRLPSVHLAGRRFCPTKTPASCGGSQKLIAMSPFVEPCAKMEEVCQPHP